MERDIIVTCVRDYNYDEKSNGTLVQYFAKDDKVACVGKWKYQFDFKGLKYEEEFKNAGLSETKYINAKMIIDYNMLTGQAKPVRIDITDNIRSIFDDEE